MAERRMFAKTIIDSDAFLDMPLSTQALYFHLGMRADDDGFVNSPRKIQRLTNCSDDDLRLLIAKNFIIPFESGVVVIKHWKIHNYIRNDRYRETPYTEEKALLNIKDNGAYSLSSGRDTTGIPSVIPVDDAGKDRIGEDRLAEDSKNKTKKRFIPPTVEEVAAYINEKGYHINAEEFVDFYQSKGWKVGKDKMSDWKAAVRNWERRRKNDNAGGAPASRSGNPFMDMLKEGDF